MGAPVEIFVIVAVVLLGGAGFCYFMSQKQMKSFQDASNRTILVVLPMSISPTSDTLPIYSPTAAVIIPSALPPSPPLLATTTTTTAVARTTAAASSSSPLPASSSSLSSTVPTSLSRMGEGARGAGIESHLLPPPSYQPIAIP
ncbi:MAG: hypothetical protein J3R72DRAFT_456668, partial [Linnemannia gamsii]